MFRSMRLGVRAGGLFLRVTNELNYGASLFFGVTAARRDQGMKALAHLKPKPAIRSEVGRWLAWSIPS